MNMSEISKVSNALGGKTARACDSCLLKRARWFCAADDAFLCQSCDASVHSANQLANRHERVRLETTSASKVITRQVTNSSSAQAPTWHQGFTTRKARTPRKHAKSTRMMLQQPTNQPLPLVPEINTDDPFAEENNQGQFLYRVPVFDPFAEDFFNEEGDDIQGGGSVANMLLDDEDLNLAELLGTCDEELFAEDVESLLLGGSGFINEDRNKGSILDEYLDAKGMKVEEEDEDDDELGLGGAITGHNDYGGQEMKLVSGLDKITTSEDDDSRSESGVNIMRNMFLRLNYEAVIAAWATQGSPWTNGTRPQFDIDQFMAAACSGGSSDWCGGRIDAEREARVLRYKEKRRTRLFSKKIRYQVRKLNAENRPRMKGRFVKRATFSASTNSLPNLYI